MAGSEFSITNFAIRNRTSFFVLVFMIILFGVMSYIQLPKEDNPDIKIPYIFVTTAYYGVSPADIETLVTKPIEKQLKGLSDVDTVASNSAESVSFVSVKFDTSVDVDTALQKVRDKVDLAKPDIPTDAEDSVIEELNFERMPAMIISLSGPYDLVKLKQIAEDIQDEVDGVTGVLDTELVGGLEREINVLADSGKLDFYTLTFDGVIQGIQQSNVNIPGGKVDVGDLKYLVRVPGELTKTSQLPQVVVAVKDGVPIYLKDVARVDTGYKEQETMSRYKTENSVSIIMTRRTGYNLIEYSKAVRAILDKMAPELPADLDVNIIGDRSEDIQSMINDLMNSIITGILLVVLVLLFFLGFRNAMFVGVAIPLSMLMSFAILRLVGVSLNMVVLFSLILALGMLVDNGIVIVENIYRHMEEGKDSISAARIGTGEVAWPVIASTLTTLAAFFPLMFWPGIMGEFMQFLPLTLMITLASSLFVALCVTPVLCATFMKVGKSSDVDVSKSPVLNRYRYILKSIVRKEDHPLDMKGMAMMNIGLFGALVWAIKGFSLINPNIEYPPLMGFSGRMIKGMDGYGAAIMLCMLAFGILTLIYVSSMRKGKSAGSVFRYQRYLIGYIGVYLAVLIGISLPFLDRPYGVMRIAVGIGPILIMAGLFQLFKRYNASAVKRVMAVYSFIFLLFASFQAMGQFNRLLFPTISPEQVTITLEMPPGTSLSRTNEVISEIEGMVMDIASQKVNNIRHFVTNVGSGGQQDNMSQGKQSTDYAEISIEFYRSEDLSQMAKDHDVTKSSLSPYETIDSLRESFKKISGGKVTIAAPQMGPPRGKPISIEITGEKFEVLESIAEKVKSVVAQSKGVVNLDDTLQDGGPEVQIRVDREKAELLGVNLRGVASTVRTAINGTKASVFRDGDDEIDINVKLDDKYRNDLEVIRYLVIEGKDGVRVPLSQFATIETASGLGFIRRVDFDRMVSVEAEVSEASGRTPFDVTQEIKANLDKAAIALPVGYAMKFGGDEEEQRKNQEFLTQAFLIAVFLIGLILVSQFNSVTVPFIILFSVILSFIGVTLGLLVAPSVFRFTFQASPFVIVMTGVGVVSLAGVVVNNAIVLLDYIRLLQAEGVPREEAIIQGGVVRFRPVVLTAVTTVLGLIPMSTGLSLDFIDRVFGILPRLITDSSSSQWWAPLADAVIFGLLVSTILTLVMVPVFYYILNSASERVKSRIK